MWPTSTSSRPPRSPASPQSSAVATEVATRVLGSGAATVMAGVLAMSIFGALQITSLVCARMPYAMARDGVFFAGLARLSPRTHVPDSRARRAGRLGDRARALRLVRHADRLRHFLRPHLRRAGDGVGLRVPPQACPTPSAPTGPGAIRSCRSCSCSSQGSWWINTLLTTPGRAFAGLGLMALGLPFYWYLVPPPEWQPSRAAVTQG